MSRDGVLTTWVRPHLLSGWQARAPRAVEMGGGRHERAGQRKQEGIWKERGRRGGSLSFPFLVKTTVRSSARSKGRRVVAQVCSWAASSAGMAVLRPCVGGRPLSQL